MKTICAADVRQAVIFIEDWAGVQVHLQRLTVGHSSLIAFAITNEEADTAIAKLDMTIGAHETTSVGVSTVMHSWVIKRTREGERVVRIKGSFNYKDPHDRASIMLEDTTGGSDEQTN